MPDADEHALLAAAQRDDVAAFGQLVRLQQGRVRGFLRRLCGDHALADDVAQERFLLAWRRLRDFRGEGSFGAWLCGIAYRRFLQSQRRQRRETVLNEAHAREWQEAGPMLETPALQQRALERAMTHLNSQEAAAITLNITLGYSHAEVAGILGLPLGTVKSLINRGLPKLRAILTSSAGVSHEDQ